MLVAFLNMGNYLLGVCVGVVVLNVVYGSVEYWESY